jgi:hypothetical protein
MVDDRDVWQAALLMVKRYRDDAMIEASERADQLLDEGDMAGAAAGRGAAASAGDAAFLMERWDVRTTGEGQTAGGDAVRGT